MEPAGAERHGREARKGELAGASESNDLQLPREFLRRGIFSLAFRIATL